MHFLYAVFFTSVCTLVGLTTVMLGIELGLNEQPNLLLLGAFEAATAGEIEKYQTGTLLFFGMAFFGVYFWGLQHILQDRNSVVKGKRVSVRVDIGGLCMINKIRVVFFIVLRYKSQYPPIINDVLFVNNL